MSLMTASQLLQPNIPQEFVTLFKVKSSLHVDLDTLSVFTALKQGDWCCDRLAQILEVEQLRFDLAVTTAMIFLWAFPFGVPGDIPI